MSINFFNLNKPKVLKRFLRKILKTKIKEKVKKQKEIIELEKEIKIYEKLAFEILVKF